MPGTDVRRQQAERLERAVREAGELALKTFRGTVKSWIKGKNSPVCEADIAVNELLRDRLDSTDIGWLSEESTDDAARLGAERVWIVDPIDGTRAYLAGLTDWSVAVALVEHGRPVAAALFAPVANEMITATAGAGAWCNGAAIAATSEHSLEGARLAGPRGYLERLQKAGQAIVPTPRIHSLALRLARVAQGTLDAALASGNSYDWDLAAADLLVHEAGGLLTTFAGRSLVYNRVNPVHDALIASGRERHSHLLKLMHD